MDPAKAERWRTAAMNFAKTGADIPIPVHFPEVPSEGPLARVANLGSFYDPNAVYVGISANREIGGGHHYYLIAGGKRMEGQLLSKTILQNSPKMTQQGVLFRLKTDPETQKAVLAAMEAQEGKACLSCVHSALEVLENAGIHLGPREKPADPFAIAANALALLSGQVSRGGKDIAVEVFANTPQDLSHFVEKANGESRVLAKIQNALDRPHPFEAELTAFALRGANYKRRAKAMNDLWLLYKNDPNFHTWLKLKEPVYKDAKDLLAQYQAFDASAVKDFKPAQRTIDLRELASNDTTEAQAAYLNKIALLRYGDKVLMGDKVLQVGKFLGAGNASNVYELFDGYGNDTGYAIKFPVITDVVFEELKRVNPSAGSNYVLQARELIKKFVENRPVADGLPTLEILGAGANGEYVIVPKLNVLEDGHEFFQRYTAAQKAGQLTPELEARWDRLSKLKVLALNSEKGKYAFADTGANFVGTEFPNRHFFWDLNREDWILGDW